MLQTSLLKNSCRLKQSDSLPLSAARGAGDRKSRSVVQGPSCGRESGDESLEAESFCT